MNKVMKKIFVLAATTMLPASCNGDYDDWADPLGNGEETAITIPGFTASSVDTINLNSVGLDTAR